MSENLYRRGRAWWGRVQIGGQDLRRSLRTDDKAEAKKRRDAWIEDLNRTAFYGENRRTYKEACGKWLIEFVPRNLKAATAERYKSSIKQLDGIFGEVYLDEITRKKVAQYISARNKGGATNSTIRRDLSALSSVLSCCVAWGWREDNPAREFDRSIIRECRDPITPPGDADVDELVAAAAPMAGRLIRFLEQTGVRLEEAASLERPQVDAARGEITLLRTKSNRPRTIKLTTPGGDAAGTIAGTPQHLKSPYVFWHGPEGARYEEFSSGFGALARRLGKKIRAHDLRHKFAIAWLRNGGDIYALSRHLGHSSVKTTEIYLGFVSGAGTKPGTATTVSPKKTGTTDAS